MNREKTTIIPVTKEIKKYIKNEEKNKIEAQKFRKKYDFKEEKYATSIENGITIIRRKDIEHKDNKLDVKIKSKINFLTDIANKLDKSTIWIYQELVLCGYGEYIETENFIYKIAKLAYDDISVLSENTLEEIENTKYNYLLNGKVYEELLIQKQDYIKKELRKVLSK